MSNVVWVYDYKFYVFDHEINFMGTINREMSHREHCAYISELVANIWCEVQYGGDKIYRIILK